MNLGSYIIRRLLLAIPTLLGITLVCFVIINMAPGGPIEQQLQAMRFGGGLGGGEMAGSGISGGESGVNEKILEMMREYYGFDKPLLHRYGLWLKSIVTLDFGRSYSYEMPVWDLIVSRVPISLQFGLTSLILTYLISVLLGVLKAVKHGSKFDLASSTVLFVLYSIPSLILGIILIVFVAGRDGSWFPLGGVVSDHYAYLSFWEQVVDRIRHFILPLLCYMVGSFTFLTLLMKNSMLDVINMDFVRTARAKGLDEKKVILKHAFRNALIPLVTGMTGILTVFFAGSIIVEQIFNINGMGLLSYQSLLARDYPVIMAMIFIQAVLYLAGRLAVDLLYMAVDPRIDLT